jgi:glycogen synthase
MRLLITTDTIGGVWTFSLELVRGLLDRDCAVALVSFGRAPSPDQQRNCNELVESFPHRFLYVASDAPLEWMRENECAFTRAAPVLARIAAQFNVDLLHSNQLCFGALDLAIPRVVTAHSDVLSWAESCDKPLPESPWLRRYLSLAGKGLAAASAVVAPTPWMMRALARFYLLPQTRLVIPNGRSIPRSNAESRKLQAMMAGRFWDPAKDLSLLSSVQSPIPILVAGEVDSCSAVVSPLPSCLKFLGPLTEECLFNTFRQSAIYLCTSKYEPFGLAALEAALCGCAVFARDIPSLREVWQDGALYFTDAASLSILLQELHANPCALVEMQKRSLRRAQYFSRDRMVDEYLKLFEMTVAKSTEATCVV